MWRSRTSGPLISIAAVFCGLVTAGCANFGFPRIDPTGERLFVPSSPPCAAPVAGAPAPVAPACPPSRGPTVIGADEDVAVLLTPHRLVAPIGSQVVLMAGVQGCDGYLRTNRRLEWSIAPGSVGQFVAIEEGGWTDFLVGDFTRPHKVTNTYAIGDTSRRYERLPGPPGNPDIVVARGQGWITVTSPLEGTSHVMVRAPDVACCNAQVQSALIHWVDVATIFPPLSNDPAGTRHVLTTTVLHHSNPCPHVGWIVRYEIAGGPPAGFAPDGAQAIEVPTDSAGQASAEIFQPQGAEGTNQIRIQVFRPAEPQAGIPGGAPAALGAERMVVDGGTLKTWIAAVPSTAAVPGAAAGPSTAAVPSTPSTAAPAPAPALDVQVVGPREEVRVGDRLTFEILITNHSQAAIRELLLSDNFDDGLEFIRPSTGQPAPTPIKDRLLGNLQPGQTTRTTLNFTARQAGQLCHTVEVSGPDGLRASARGCVTVVEAPPRETPAPSPRGLLTVTAVVVDVPAAGADRRGVEISRATAGQLVDFIIDVTNVSPQPLKNITVTDESDPALQPKQATEEGYQPGGRNVVWTIPELAAGAKTQFRLQSLCNRVAERACNRVAVTTPDGAHADAEACLEIREAPPAAPGGLAVTATELQNPVFAGDPITYLINVANSGAAAESQVAVTVKVPLGVTLDKLRTSGPTPPNYEPDGQTVRFTPLPEIQPRQSQTYRVRVQTSRTSQAGEVRTRVEAASREHPQPAVGERTTKVLPPRE
jgi:uncharacterized repeat protein (TIGR01451 family)